MDEAEGEVAYEELTISYKNKETGKVVLITGKVAKLSVWMSADGYQNEDFSLERGAWGAIYPELLKVNLTAEWVKEEQIFYRISTYNAK